MYTETFTECSLSIKCCVGLGTGLTNEEMLPSLLSNLFGEVMSKMNPEREVEGNPSRSEGVSGVEWGEG